MTAGLIIDIVIGVLLLVAIIVGAVKGLFKTVISLVIVIAAIIGSVFFSGLLAGPVTDLVYPAVSEKLEKLVTEPSLHINLGAILSHATESKIDEFLAADVSDDFFEQGIPEEIVKIAKQFGISEENVQQATRNALKAAQDMLRKYMESQKAPGGMSDAEAQGVAEDAVKVAAKSYLRPLVRGGLIILLFIILSILMHILESVIDEKVKKTGGVKQVNSLGGAILSLAICIVVIYLVVYLCSRVGIINIYADKIEDSYVLPVILKFVPK